MAGRNEVVARLVEALGIGRREAELIFDALWERIGELLTGNRSWCGR
jgi:hypothetical protein